MSFNIPFNFQINSHFGLVIFHFSSVLKKTRFYTDSVRHLIGTNGDNRKFGSVPFIYFLFGQNSPLSCPRSSEESGL